MEWITARLFQASTVKGLIQLGGSMGLWSLSPSMEAAIVAAVMGVLGLINLYIDEHKATKQLAAEVAVNVTEQTLVNNGIATDFQTLAEEVRNK